MVGEPATTEEVAADDDANENAAADAAVARRGYAGRVGRDVRSTATAFVRSVDDDALSKADLAGVTRVHVRVRVGAFVAYEDVLATLEGVPADDAVAIGTIRDAVVIDATRSAEQDLLFDVRQLVDIALRALSPGINDPTTAERALYYLGDILARLGKRAFPSAVRVTADRSIRITLTRPVWEDFVAESFDQIRDSARGNAHVLSVLLDVLRRLERVVPADRVPPVRDQIALARAQRRDVR